MLFEEEWPQSIGISEFVTGWEVVRLPNPLAFGSQVGTLSSERVSPSQGERVSILIFYWELYKARRARGWGGICFDEPMVHLYFTLSILLLAILIPMVHLKFFHCQFWCQWFIYISLWKFSHWQFWCQTDSALQFSKSLAVAKPSWRRRWISEKCYTVVGQYIIVCFHHLSLKWVI